MAVIKGRIDNAPAVAEKLTELTRGYEELNTAYQKLHSKWLEARMSANMERTQRGEQFEVVDPAQVPDAPFRPQVKRAIPVTVGLALVLSVGLAFGLSYIDVSFTSTTQLERQTGLPVLMVLPPLETPEEQAAAVRRNMIFGAVFGLIFIFLLGLVGILVTGRGPALKTHVHGDGILRPCTKISFIFARSPSPWSPARASSCSAGTTTKPWPPWSTP